MVCGKQRAGVVGGAHDGAVVDGRAHRAVGREQAAVGVDRRSLDAERPLDVEGPRVRLERDERHEVGPQEGLGARQDALDGLAVGQGGVDLLADVADLDELAVERLQADEIAFGALGAHLVGLDLGERADDRVDQVVELGELVAVARVVVFVAAAEPPPRAPDQRVDRPVHPDVEHDDHQGKGRRQRHAELHELVAVELAREHGDDHEEDHDDHPGRLDFDAHAGAALVRVARGSLLRGFQRPIGPRLRRRRRLRFLIGSSRTRMSRWRASGDGADRPRRGRLTLEVALR